MKLTCLHCGKQLELATGTANGAVVCDCTRNITIPNLKKTAIRPNARAAERALRRAFLSAGMINNRWQIALFLAVATIFVPPLAIASIAVAIAVLRDKAGSLARYAGHRQALIAIFLAIFNAILSLSGAYYFYNDQVMKNRQYVQKSAARDLRALAASENSFYSSHGHFGTFDEISFMAPEGLYTLCLADEIKKPRSALLKTVNNCPDESLLEDDHFTAVAVANLDGDDTLDIWAVNEDGVVTNLQNDLED